MVHKTVWWKKITKNTKPTKNPTYYAQWNKKLSSEEKKLVGKYSYGNIQSGWWSYAYSSGGFNYEKYNDGFGALITEWYKADGTFESHSIFFGKFNPGGSTYIITTANWHIPTKGIVRFSNRVENIRNNDGSTSQWLQSQNPNWNPNKNYYFTERGGKKGITYSDPEDFTSYFYQRVS